MRWVLPAAVVACAPSAPPATQAARVGRDADAGTPEAVHVAAPSLDEPSPDWPPSRAASLPHDAGPKGAAHADCTRACAEEGQCHADGAGGCEVRDDADCHKSRACRKERRCVARETSLCTGWPYPCDVKCVRE
jgi:hypothetical protein